MEQQSGLAGAIKVLLGMGSQSAEASGSAEVERKSSSIVEKNGEYQHRGIRALPNGRWKIENPRKSDTAIESSILTGERLCAFILKEYPNRIYLEVQLSAQKVDIDVVSKTRRRRIRQKKPRSDRGDSRY